MRLYAMKWARLSSVLMLSALLLTFCKRPEQPSEPTPPEEQTTPGDNPGDSGEVPGETPVDPETPEVKPVKVSDITILPSDELSLEIGKTAQLSVEIAPENAEDKGVTWSSESTSIATVSDKGLVTAVAVGETNIVVKSKDGGAQSVKPVTVFKPQPQAFTSISITNLSDILDHYVGRNYVFTPGEQFRFRARGVPEDAPDEIEFACVSGGVPAFTIDSWGRFYALAGNMGGNSYIYARSKKNPNVRSGYVNIRVSGPYANRAVLVEDTYGYFMPKFYPVSAQMLRHTSYIGRGATQRFTIKVETKDTDGNLGYSYPCFIEIVSSDGPVEFSLTSSGVNSILIAKAPSSIPFVSSPSNIVKSNLTFRIGSYTRTVEFIVSELDPYTPKVGDGLYYKEDKFLDGGNRGNGIFEESKYGTSMPCDAMIAWVGNTHLTEDPLYASYCKGGITSTDGRVVHGIVIPAKTGYLYRKNRDQGEVFADTGEDITKSDALPSWFNTGQLPWRNYYKMTAFSNTAALVYRNGRNGTSHDVKPMNFFVSSEILEPSSKETKKITVSSFSWESDFYGDFYSGNLKSSDDYFSSKARYSWNSDLVISPWLMPSVSDLYMIFADERPSLSNVTYDSPVGPYTIMITDKVTALRTCGKNISGSTPGYVHSFWTCQQKAAEMAPVFTVEMKYSNYYASVSEKSKTGSRAYVLPIAYF